jgi:hypothetical protein
VDAILDQIRRERAYQDTRFGHEFDDKNTVNDWVAFITVYAARAVRDADHDGLFAREAFIKVAALAVAACEAHDRNKDFPARHFD